MSFRCLACGALHTAPGEFSGERIRCAKCGALVPPPFHKRAAKGLSEECQEELEPIGQAGKEGAGASASRQVGDTCQGRAASTAGASLATPDGSASAAEQPGARVPPVAPVSPCVAGYSRKAAHGVRRAAIAPVLALAIVPAAYLVGGHPLWSSRAGTKTQVVSDTADNPEEYKVEEDRPGSSTLGLRLAGVVI